MTIPFAPTASDLATLKYVWYGPYNDIVMTPNYDTTTLSVVWYGPRNYGPPDILPHQMFLCF